MFGIKRLREKISYLEVGTLMLERDNAQLLADLQKANEEKGRQAARIRAYDAASLDLLSAYRALMALGADQESQQENFGVVIDRLKQVYDGPVTKTTAIVKPEASDEIVPTEPKAG